MIPHIKDINDEKEIEEVDIDHLYQYEKQTHYHWYDQILLNKPLKVVLVTLLVSIAAPILIYHFLFFPSEEQPPSDGSTGSCVLPRAFRLPCGLGQVSQQECHPQCCYDLHSHVCFHRYPSRFSYIMDRDEWTENVILQPRVQTVPFSSQYSTPNLRLSIDEVSPTHMSLEFYKAGDKSISGRRIENKNYTYHVASPELTVSVEAAQGLIFSTIRGPLIASNDIWEIAFKLTNETMYGFGELPMIAGTNRVIYRRQGDFGSIPLIYAKVNDSYHGLLIDTEAPTEVLMHEDNQIVLRIITDSGLKLHVFVGPKPSDVMAEVTKVIGVNEQLEYWMLGAHICSDPSETPEDTMSDLDEFIRSASSEGLPFESHCGSPIVFDSDCNQESIVEIAANVVKAAGKRYVPQVSPYILYHEEDETTSNETDAYRTGEETCADIVSEYKHYMLHNLTIPDHDQVLYVGSVGEDTFVYPVFENSSIEFMRSLWAYEVKPDGIILENNWPLDESEQSDEISSFLPYFSQSFVNAFEKTPKWNATRFNDTTNYFHKHNEYGNHFISAFKTILNDSEIPMWSSSQWMNGKINVNRQHINASWTSLKKELEQAALGGVSGHWLWSVPVCGDTDAFDLETQTGLCIKWYMAATYMPLIKIHSSSTPIHPLTFTGTTKNLMVGALNKRLSLLPYFFTTLQSGPLLRPMFYQFPASEHLKDLNTQYGVGEELVIVPNLLPSQTHVHFWMPPGVWYELWGGLRIKSEEGEPITMTTTEADFLTLIRGGAILVMQKDVKTTAEETRLHSMYSLTIALDCEKNDTTTGQTNSSLCLATGALFLDKQMTILFESNDEQLTIMADGDDFAAMCGDNPKWARVVRDISIYGLDDEHNNYDNHSQLTVNIDLCNLEDAANHEIVFSILD